MLPLPTLGFLGLAVLLSTGCAWKASILDGGSGPPLTKFRASDGKYFPEFLLNFFPGAAHFSRELPRLESARSDMQLIEVKRLDERNPSYNEANLSWSADGVYLSFESITANQRKILVKDILGNYVKELLVVPRGQGNFLDGMVARSIQSYNSGLSWSRDSTRFAFMSNGGVGEYNVYVGAVGSKEEAVAKSSAKDGYANWSPNSNELVFVSGRSGGGDLYLLDLARGDVQRLTTSSDVDLFPQWFPKGNRIVYSSGDALNHDILLLERNAAGSWQQPVRLTRWQRDDLRPTVSPDGKWVAFYADSGEADKYSEERRWNIYVIPLTEGTPRTFEDWALAGMKVAEDVVVDLNTGPAWSPDSRKLFYVKRDPNEFNPIYGCDLFSGRQYKFATGTRMNRDILVSRLGVLSFRAQVGVWDRVFLALTNQGVQLQSSQYAPSKIHYL